jgi:hypothetical protein
MSAHPRPRGGGASLGYGAAITDATPNQILFADANEELAGDPDFTYDQANNRFTHRQSAASTNPTAATMETVIANSAANNGWIFFAPNGSARRAAIGQILFGGDDAIVTFADRYHNFITGANVLRMQLSNVAGLLMQSAMQRLKGADIASASTMTFDPLLGDTRHITGTTTINHITTTNWQAGAVIRLRFTASLTVTNNAGSPPGGTAPIRLAAAGNMSATALDVLDLYFDGTEWVETNRSVN